MKKIFVIIPLIWLLSACSDDFIRINNEVITGVVQIYNISDDAPKIVPAVAPNTQTVPGPGTTPIPNPTPLPQSSENDPKDSESSPLEMGSGFLIAPNVIITNFHVVDGVKRHFVVQGYNDMKKYVAHIVAGDKTADIAILKIDEWDDFNNTIHPAILNWGHSAYLRQGEKVWAIGHPYGFSWSLSAGLISSLLRQDTDSNPARYYIQTDTSINPGNSGGPLFDSEGNVIGINAAIFGSKGFVGLTIPGDYAKKVINDLLHGGKIREGRIGIVMRPSADSHFILIDSIIIGSNAIKAGLLPNDIINAIYNPDSNLKVELKIPYQLQYQIKSLDPGSEITLYITRDHIEHKAITFALGGEAEVIPNPAPAQHTHIPGE
jgi:serine protease Do